MEFAMRCARNLEQLFFPTGVTLLLALAGAIVTIMNAVPF